MCRFASWTMDTRSLLNRYSNRICFVCVSFVYDRFSVLNAAAPGSTRAPFSMNSKPAIGSRGATCPYLDVPYHDEPYHVEPYLDEP